jgi:hypothetical protein
VGRRHAPRCRATDPYELGGNTILGIDGNGRITQHAYFKMPAAQTETENCVSHNGGLIPVPGRDIMVQGWYQGGVNVFDFTDPDNPYRDRLLRPRPGRRRATSWSAVRGARTGTTATSTRRSSSRGLDVLELTPSEHLSQNEIDAAKLVIMEEYNPQSQPKLVWPAAFPWCAPTSISSRATMACRRRAALNRLAGELDGDAARSSDASRVRALAGAVRDLAAQ